MSLQSVNEAFLDAFTPDEFERLVFFALGETLDTIAPDGSFTAKVFHATGWAHRNGKLNELIAAAKNETENEFVKDLKAPDTRVVGSSEASHRAVTNLELISYQLQQLRGEVDSLKRIVTGTDGTNGVRSQSVENARKIEEIRKMLVSIQNESSWSPLGSTAGKVVFGAILLSLGITTVLVAAGTFGWI